MQSEQKAIETMNSIAAVNTVRNLAAKEGAQIYLAGEAVRDLLLGLMPNEFDLIVSGNPVEFARKIAAVAPGQVRSNESGDSAYYRGELGTLNFVSSKGLPVQLCVDLYYCFTVNCVLFDLEHNKILYFHSSKADIENRVIRVVSPVKLTSYSPHISLRAIRLALLTPTFTLDQQTFLSVRSNSSLMSRAKPFMVFNELFTILRSKEYLKGIRLLDDAGILQEVFKDFLLFAASEEQAPNELSTLSTTTRICAAMDDLTGPFQALLSESISDCAFLLRITALLIPKTRQHLLNISHADRRRFLIIRGEQIEKALCNVMLPSRAFRIRIIAISYLLGVVSLSDRNVRIEEVCEQSVKAFGAWKGLLAGILICADWLAFERRDGTRAEMFDRANAILQTNLARLTCRKAIRGTYD